MRCFLFLIAFFLLAGCASNREFGGDPSIQLYQSTELPAPTGIDFIGPFDKLSIVVVGHEDLSLEDVQADSEGRVNVPLVGTVDAKGKAPRDLADLITQGLRERHVRDPQVTVNLTDALHRLVTVGGEVKDPGMYPANGNMTLLRAIARAKGLNEFARRRDVVVFRTVEGQRYAALYNIDAIERGAYQDPRIYAEDVVVVGSSPGRTLLKNILLTAPALLSPLVYVIR